MVSVFGNLNPRKNIAGGGVKPTLSLNGRWEEEHKKECLQEMYPATAQVQ